MIYKGHTNEWWSGYNFAKLEYQMGYYAKQTFEDLDTILASFKGDEGAGNKIKLLLKSAVQDCKKAEKRTAELQERLNLLQGSKI